MKNKAAVALGRRGGKAKNAKLTEEQRKEMMAEVRRAKAFTLNFTPSKHPARRKDAGLPTGMKTPRINDGECVGHATRFMPNQLYPPVRAAKMTRHWQLPAILLRAAR
jgi:hypothetical protein